MDALRGIFAILGMGLLYLVFIAIFLGFWLTVIYLVVQFVKWAWGA